MCICDKRRRGRMHCILALQTSGSATAYCYHMADYQQHAGTQFTAQNSESVNDTVIA